MKLSVSMDDTDVAFIDRFASAHGVHSRSGVIQRALELLRASELRDDYVEAFREWSASDQQAWDGTVADGGG